MITKRNTLVAAAAGVALVTVAGSAFAAGLDFGLKTQSNLASASEDLFGFKKPLAASSTASISQAEAIADPTALVSVAKGLKVRTVATVPNAPVIDQSAFWPSLEKPTHLISCDEDGALGAALIAIELKTGTSQVIVRSGLNSCDPVRLTAWGTILFGEESGATGRQFEMVDPLNTHDVDVTATSTGSPTIVDRTPVLGSLSYEGLALYPSGVTYYADENRPNPGANGVGAYFKFIPSTPWNGTPVVTAADLARSPYAAGSVYGLRVGNRGDNAQGTEVGLGTWVSVCTPAAPCGSLRPLARTLNLTGYYRPEDAEVDGTALAVGNVKFCANNTGNEITTNAAGAVTSGHTWGNTICISDGTLDQALANTAKPDVQLLIVGNEQLSMQDNIAQQPRTGNWYIHEDGSPDITGHNNDLWACLPDGADDDTLSDGCVRAATLNDLTAEWTGGIFDASGKTFYVSVQHNISGQGTILAITGFNR